MVNRSTTSISLFDGFRVTSATAREGLRPAAQRLVAFLALNRQRHTRSYIAGSLWAGSDEPRALASLRSTLWQVRQLDRDLLDGDKDSVQLAAPVLVDTDVLGSISSQLRAIARQDEPTTPAWTNGFDDLVERLGRELLPGWYEDWVQLERQRIDQLRLHALEALAELRRREGAHGLALDAALRAVQLEPLRETAHLAVVQIHLSEGNVGAAVQARDRYAALLRTELGVAPPSRMTELIADATADRVIDLTPYGRVLTNGRAPR